MRSSIGSTKKFKYIPLSLLFWISLHIFMHSTCLEYWFLPWMPWPFFLDFFYCSILTTSSTINDRLAWMWLHVPLFPWMAFRNFQTLVDSFSFLSFFLCDSPSIRFGQNIVKTCQNVFPKMKDLIGPDKSQLNHPWVNDLLVMLVLLAQFLLLMLHFLVLLQTKNPTLECIGWKQY